MKRMLLIFALYFSITSAWSDEIITAKVLTVYDGDTVQVTYNNEIHNIRFLGIDCYETSKINRAYKQAYLNHITIDEVIRRGKYSKKFLNKYLETSNYVDVILAGKDIYNRDLATLYNGKVNINRLMIGKGKCMPYQYKK